MTILFAGLLAGTLDGIAATLLFLSGGNKNPGTLFRYIASAVYGKAAFAGGGLMVFMGLLFHFLIALVVVSCYFVLYPHITWLGVYPLAAAAVYGLLVWVVMNLGVLPLSKASPRPFSWVFALINMLILMVAIGLPTAYLARMYFRG